MEDKILESKMASIEIARNIYNKDVKRIESVLKELNECTDKHYWYNGVVCLSNTITRLGKTIEELKRLEGIARGSYRVLETLESSLREELYLENEGDFFIFEDEGYDTEKILDYLMQGYSMYEALRKLEYKC